MRGYKMPFEEITLKEFWKDCPKSFKLFMLLLASLVSYIIFVFFKGRF